MNNGTLFPRSVWATRVPSFLSYQRMNAFQQCGCQFEHSDDIHGRSTELTAVVCFVFKNYYVNSLILLYFHSTRESSGTWKVM